jgi:hypothetical protein
MTIIIIILARKEKYEGKTVIREGAGVGGQEEEEEEEEDDDDDDIDMFLYYLLKFY